MTREKLFSVRDLKIKLRLLEQCRENLLATAEDLVPITDDLPRSKAAKSKVEELAIKILEVDTQLDEVREQIIQVEVRLAEQIISKVSNLALQTFAVLRYVKCLSYKEIARQMDYSLRHVYFLRRKFLKHFISSPPCYHSLPNDIVTTRKMRG